MILLVVTILLPTTLVGSARNLSTHADVELEPGEIEFTSVPSFTFHGNMAFVFSQPYYHTDGDIDGIFTIEDARGSDAGWSIRVSLSEFHPVERPDSTSLSGAQVHLAKPTLVSKNENPAPSFEGYPVTMTAGDDVFHQFVIAKKGTSGGVWEGTVPSAQFDVKKGSISVGLHRATMYWSLEDTP